MPRRDEATLERWTHKASDTEDARYEWTKRAVREVLDSCTYQGNTFDIYAKGSYPNHTNVVRDSDVDIAVELTSITHEEFIHDAQGLSMPDVGVTPYTGTYGLRQFKNDVEAALVSRFGRTAVARGNKAIHVRESRQGLKADVVVCQTAFSHLSRTWKRQGILIQADDGNEIINYPRQHLDEGIAKNARTNKRYKRTVRILKRLESEMVGSALLEIVPSFLIESLVWNIPDNVFNNAVSWTARVEAVLRHAYQAYKERDEWLEANGIKFLFHSTQRWNERQADAFALTALQYLEFA